MVRILGMLLMAVFAILASIHFFWALGGNRGFVRALPTAENSEPV
jgi:hypothetical protein